MTFLIFLAVSLYPSILEVPFSRTEPVSGNSGIVELLAGSGPNPGHISGLNPQYALQYASPLGTGATPAQLLYGSWLGTGEPKNTSQLFGLQGKTLINLNITLIAKFEAFATLMLGWRDHSNRI